ncbi:hypothetical protein ACHQM5_027968 [Ranunculus cassubicifolius]
MDSVIPNLDHQTYILDPSFHCHTLFLFVSLLIHLGLTFVSAHPCSSYEKSWGTVFLGGQLTSTDLIFGGSDINRGTAQDWDNHPRYLSGYIEQGILTALPV